MLRPCIHRYGITKKCIIFDEDGAFFLPITCNPITGVCKDSDEKECKLRTEYEISQINKEALCLKK